MPLSSTQALVFVAIVFAPMAPYFAFGMYASVHYPGGAWQNPWPLWFRYTIPGWFMANVLIAEVLRKRVLTSKVPEQERRRLAREVTLQIGVGLDAFWSLLSRTSSRGGILGKTPLDRAIAPAIFLLLFIGFLGWAVGMAERGKA
jgi:hypothetical protein